MKKIILLLLMLCCNGVVFGQSKLNQKIDSIVVIKKNRDMFLYSKGSMYKKYKIALGKKKLPKEKEGDRRTPEGYYIITDKNPNSNYSMNLGINYPNKQDILLKRTGGDIKIHGIKNGFGFLGKLHRIFNWTNGCIAVTNKEMKELYNLIDVNTIINIKP
jgi:murein L,D-transpeptidase YafK